MGPYIRKTLNIQEESASIIPIYHIMLPGNVSQLRLISHHDLG